MAFLPSMAGAAASSINEKTAFTSVQPAVTKTATMQAVYTTNHMGVGSLVGQVPRLQTIINANGSITVLDPGNVGIKIDAKGNSSSAPSDTAVVYEFSADGKLTKTHRFIKPLPLIGAFTKDSSGNYYIFYGIDVSEGAFSQKNTALIKYSPSGQKIAETWFEASVDNSRYGIKIPFDSSSCRMEISGNMIMVYFAKEQFVSDSGANHQSSSGFILTTDTLSLLSNRLNTTQQEGTLEIPFASHAFNQFILPIKDGFIVADHSDGTPARSFVFSKIKSGVFTNVTGYSFVFDGAAGDNTTNAELGGIVQTSSGYLFAGTYGKAPRNLFLLNLSDNLQGGDKPIWLTDYTNPDTRVIAPKIVKIADNKHIVMWETYTATTPTPQDAKTYMAVVNDKGEILSTSQITGVRLNAYDVLR
jgi:hypothetical protein